MTPNTEIGALNFVIFPTVLLSLPVERGVIKQWVLALLAELEEAVHAGGTVRALWLANEAEGEGRRREKASNPKQDLGGTIIFPVGRQGRLTRCSYRRLVCLPSFIIIFNLFSCPSLWPWKNPFRNPVAQFLTTGTKHTQPEYGHSAQSLAPAEAGVYQCISVTKWYQQQYLLTVYLALLCQT